MIDSKIDGNICTSIMRDHNNNNDEIVVELKAHDDNIHHNHSNHDIDKNHVNVNAVTATATATATNTTGTGTTTSGAIGTEDNNSILSDGTSWNTFSTVTTTESPTNISPNPPSFYHHSNDNNDDELLLERNNPNININNSRKSKSFLPQFEPSKEIVTPTIPTIHNQQFDQNNNNINNPLIVEPILDSVDTTGFFDEEEEDENDDNENSGHVDNDNIDNLLPAISLIKHGRQPSTIVEETTERKDDNNIIHEVQEQQPLLSKQQQKSSLSPLRKTKPSLSLHNHHHQQQNHNDNDKNYDPLAFTPSFPIIRFIQMISCKVLPEQHIKYAGGATWIGFWSLLYVTCSSYVLTPMRDAIALAVGVKYMPALTLASTVLAVFSSVPIGWLFEAPDPSRRKVWKRMGLTRGETQGSSLALFYRFFAFIVLSYAIGFQLLEFLKHRHHHNDTAVLDDDDDDDNINNNNTTEIILFGIINITKIWSSLGQILYIAFFLVVHLMKLHSTSLVWGVTTEAMEYEEVARKHHYEKINKQNNLHHHNTDNDGNNTNTTTKIHMESNKMRLKRLSLVGFGGTLGGILGSMLASSMAELLKLPGLLVVAACLLEVSAELSTELGRIMQKHWEEQQQLFQSTNDLASLDPSMKRSASLGSMKRISSGNSLNRVKSTSDLGGKPLSSLSTGQNHSSSTSTTTSEQQPLNEDTFSQRMMRGITTILRSRLLMAIFTYNALYASTTVLLSFQRAVLVANRSDTTSVQADTAFLANINMASSAAIFALQASGAGAYVAHKCGSRGTLALMPLIRLLGVLALAYWHRFSGGRPPNLLVFLVVDECCKIMNLAVAKPVRESLWRGLSNEARYEAKPIVDTLANRWGGGSAAFLVSFVDKTLDLFGVLPDEKDGVRNIFGFPPILFLCIIIAAWWSVVSADLGQIRKNIDLELKKRQ